MPYMGKPKLQLYRLGWQDSDESCMSYPGKSSLVPEMGKPEQGETQGPVKRRRMADEPVVV
ncbi:hypothetical protein DU53_00590 [Kosmotoga sp. DU53]|uniref:Uncharacterized protein n=1 Tax=Kosmotoga olearia (strain ATCC BAA-1733 / DSM 21960 / TBF 19.5.1) TaxID=521045 RepID=C5CDE0_KOSOT|nr:hypothetical protein Kole_1309 [Kosmotoga olearia TBF 19.5.1]ACR80028.1 hypothetical protein Kole_1334 [Kosmotoga olearia TBF 19.5.1]OAA24850.1 hypothetical protein DU53_00590 [Kosmotoga sp. DU53]